MKVLIQLQTGDTYSIDVVVLVNTEAEVIFADGTKKIVGSGEYHFEC